jgi:amino acid transporter
MLSFGKRPRELSWFHAGPMLFGDWGTSRLYVLGIAFAATGHASFTYVAAMGVVLLIVAWAYTIICRAYPEGGGVYAAAREQAPILGVTGGLLLYAGYVMTGALSAVAAFHYLGVAHADLWAMGAIVLLGAVHYFGPKKAGVLALWIAAAAFVSYLVIAAFSLPHLGDAHVRVPRASLGEHWTQLVHVILALSGVEVVANMTGIMVSPVGTTSRKTIWPVAFEVVTLNLLFALAMNAIPVPEKELAAREGDMLRAVAEHYVGGPFATAASVVFAALLLSAASTAVTGMLGVQFSMARDGELPRAMARLNRYGVPFTALVLSTLAPVLVLVVVRDIEGLAPLYAIGVVGAIALNGYATARSRRPGVRPIERAGLWFVAVLMGATWVTIAVSEPPAFFFAVAVLGIGLAARFAFRRYREIVRPVERVPFPADAPRILVATRGDSWIVDRGYERAGEIGAAVVVILIREASFVFGARPAEGLDPAVDPEADRVFTYARKAAQDRDLPVRTIYELSTSPMSLLADHAVTLGVQEVHVGGSRRSKIEKVLRGNPLDELRNLLPPEVRLVVHRPLQGVPDPRKR